MTWKQWRKKRAKAYVYRDTSWYQQPRAGYLASPVRAFVLFAAVSNLDGHHRAWCRQRRGA